jgi:hypothetical protein
MDQFKRYPVPIGDGFFIIAMMKFKSDTTIKAQTPEVWKYDADTQGFFCIDLELIDEIKIRENDFFPVYEFTKLGVKIFIWDQSTQLGVFVDVPKDLIGKIIERIETHRFSMN